MPKEIGQSKPEMPALDDVAILELKANLNSEQREHLDILKTKMKKILGGKTKQELAKAGDLLSLRKYKSILEEILEFLKTKEIKIQISEKTEIMEKELNLQEQYEEQFEILKKTGVIKELSDGRWGMLDILGQEQPIPSYDEIWARLNAKAEMLDIKRQQRFTKLLLVPIGMKLSEMIKRAKKLIVEKHKEGNLLATDGTTKLRFDINNYNKPIWSDKKYNNDDVSGDLVYYPQKFDQKNHGGMSKLELIEKTGAWQIMFIEDLPDLPAKGKQINGRKQFDGGDFDTDPKEYLENIKVDPQYAGEQFTTPEAQLIYFIGYLQQHNQVIDDYEGSGRAYWNLGAFFKESARVPVAHWYRPSGQFYLDDRFLNHFHFGSNHGVRPSVII